MATRRAFIQSAVPLAAAAASVPLSAAGAESTNESADPRLARLEDLHAIRALNQAFAKARGLEPVDFGQQDVIEVAADRQTATALLHGTVNVEEPIGPEAPLVDMARQQGGGVVRRRERGVFEHHYQRRDGAWSIRDSTYRSLLL